MKIYECKKCMKIFSQKSTYDYHISRKYPCIKNTEEKEDKIKNKCINCSKLYSTKYNLKVHMKSCNKLIEFDYKMHIEELKNMFEKKFEEQQKDNQELKKKVEELSHINETNNIIETNNNIIINDNSTTNNTINIYSSGKEDLSRLSHEDVIKLCTSGTYYPLIAAEILHCNEKYPEFQNVLISNLRATTGLIKINDKWVTKSQDEVLNNMMNVDKKHISTLIKDLEVEKKLKVKLESTQDEIDTNECKEHHKDKIKQKLYDASNMIRKHKKQSEKK